MIGPHAKAAATAAVLLTTLVMPVHGSAAGAPGTIDTFAGGSIGEGVPALDSSVYEPYRLALGRDALYFGDVGWGFRRLRRMDLATGMVETVAGGRENAFAGDGGCARDARLHMVGALAVDTHDPRGDVVYFVDRLRIRRIVPAPGCPVIETIAGNGVASAEYSDGPATEINISPGGLAVASDHTVYFTSQQRVLRLADGMVTTIAGTGVSGSSGDGGPALEATFGLMPGVAIDPQGRVIVADSNGARLRRVDLAVGTVDAVPGGAGTFFGVDIAADGTIYAAAWPFDGRIFRITPSGQRRVVAGGGPLAVFDGVPATLVSVSAWDVTVTPGGELLISSSTCDCMYRVRVDGAIETMTGRTCTWVGDGGAATDAGLCHPTGVSPGPDGSILIADTYHARIRRVDADGTIRTIAGNGSVALCTVDFVPATEASICSPTDVAFDPVTRSIYVSDGASRVRVIGDDGIIRPFAGNGVSLYAGDGGPAIAASIVGFRLAIDAASNVYISDPGHCVVRRVDIAGIITTVAGTGSCGFSGDGGPATSAQLCEPVGIASGPRGDLFVGDTCPLGGVRIRRVDVPDGTGTITTVAGTGFGGNAGEDGPPEQAEVSPYGLATDAMGRVYIADGACRVLRLEGFDPETGWFSVIRRIAGSGVNGLDEDHGGLCVTAGDGGPARDAQVLDAQGIAIDGTGNLYIVEQARFTVRVVYGIALS